MESFFERLLDRKFSSSREAIEFCRELCTEFGFDITKGNSDNRSVYLHCSYDNALDGRENSAIKKRPSTLKNTECPWRLVVTLNELSEWIFRKPINQNAAEHNHPLQAMNNELIWPQEVYNRIGQLARQKNLKTDEIRETIKLQFPHIAWNDRLFLDYLKEHRPQDTTATAERVQKLILASTRLCSVVAANEDWANCVESDMLKLLESYAQLTRVSSHQLDSMVDLELDMIHSEIDKTRRLPKPEEHTRIKKRPKNKSNQDSANTQVMSIPSCTLYVRSQPLRSMSEPSAKNRRAFSDLVAHTPLQQPMQSFGSSFFNLNSPASSPSSTSSIQQRMDYNNTFHRNISNHSNASSSTDILQSPSIGDNVIMSGFGSSGGHSNSGSGNGGHSSTYSSNMYSMPPYSAYTPSSTSYTAQSGDMNFTFDSNHYQHLSPSPAHMMVHRPQPASSSSSASPDRLNYSPMNYSYSPIIRDPPATSLQQRIMLQQEYEQHQRHIQQMESRMQLPIIRNTGMMPMVQQPSNNMNSNHPQTWS